ncbi:MAG: RluA family pseudouridine synthase [bacterium]|nr:RluA family pseudouridine synthase [bacterium]
MTDFPIIVRPKEKIRLDKYLYKSGLGISRSQIQKLIENGNVLVNDNTTKSHTILKYGDKVFVDYKKPQPFQAKAESILLDIIFEDEDVIVINKPPGMVTHPAPGHLGGTLVNALLGHCELCKDTDRTRPGVIHRIDKDTSGLLIFAKTNTALLGLSKQIEARSVKRKYISFVWGRLPSAEGTVNAPIGRNTIERKIMAVTPLNSRKAITHYKVINKFKYITEIKASLDTGRTHQIRVHFNHIGNPVVGDPTYGGRKQLPGVPIEEFNKIMEIISRQALHAAFIEFIHPISKEPVSFSAPLPDDMQQLSQYLSTSLKTSLSDSLKTTSL